MTEAGCKGVCAVLSLRRMIRLPTAGPSAAEGGVADHQMEGGERLRRKPLCVCREREREGEIVGDVGKCVLPENKKFFSEYIP